MTDVVVVDDDDDDDMERKKEEDWLVGLDILQLKGFYTQDMSLTI